MYALLLKMIANVERSSFSRLSPLRPSRIFALKRAAYGFRNKSVDQVANFALGGIGLQASAVREICGSISQHLAHSHHREYLAHAKFLHIRRLQDLKSAGLLSSAVICGHELDPFAVVAEHL